MRDKEGGRREKEAGRREKEGRRREKEEESKTDWERCVIISPIMKYFVQAYLHNLLKTMIGKLTYIF